MAIDATDEGHLRRAIALAMRGRGGVEPNPMVGCVIARGGSVIGAGWHQRFGGPHAEVEALAACAGGAAGMAGARGASGATGATACVTLEPCCHAGSGKKTPPCAPALIAAGVTRVVVGCLDPNPKVNGGGVAALRAAGIDVEVGALEAECRQLIAPFIALTRLGRPYVTVKWAVSADGKVAGPGGRRTAISNEFSMAAVHGLRARCDAILVGIGTALADDPMLTARAVDSELRGRPASATGAKEAGLRGLERAAPATEEGAGLWGRDARRALRVVMDGRARLPMGSALARTAREWPVRVYCLMDAADGERAAALRDGGVEVVGIEPDATGRVSIATVLQHLGRDNRTHLLVEAGPELAGAFVRGGYADRLWEFRCGRRIDDMTAPNAAAAPEGYFETGKMELEGDVLVESLNPGSAAYFGKYRSADWGYVERDKVTRGAG